MPRSKGKFWPYVRPLIWEKAQQLYQEEQARTMGTDFKGITATKRELREGRYFHRAKIIVLNNLYRQKKGLPTVEEWEMMQRYGIQEDKAQMFFKKKHIKKILKHRKTQTRRIGKRQYKIGHRYGIRSSRIEKSVAHIVIARRFKEKLGQISLEDAKKEGYESVEEFCRDWEKDFGSWNPEETVSAYEFELVSSDSEES